MTIQQQRQYNRFNRSIEFLDQHAKDFSPSSRAITLRDELKAVVAQLQEKTENQGAKKPGHRNYSSDKLDALNALRAEIVQIARTAQVISQHDSGFKNTFEVPDKRRKDELVKAAQQFKKDAAKNKQAFIDWEMSEDFLDRLQTRIDGYEAAQKGQAQTNTAKAGSTDEVGNLLEQGIRIMGALEVVVENKYHGNKEVTEEWQNAAAMERSTRRRKNEK